MEKVVLHPAYFPNIATLAFMVKNNVLWEVNDNYQKQTYRNRCHIATDSGRHLLTIPIKHVGGSTGRQKYKDVRIDNTYRWQQQHWRTLQMAYRTSAFFEFYEDDLAPLYARSFEFLLDFNFATIHFLSEALNTNFLGNKTKSYNQNYHDALDARMLVNAKKQLLFEHARYFQVFDDRNGFIDNTSGLDLLFNEGTNALDYLQSQNAPLPNV